MINRYDFFTKAAMHGPDANGPAGFTTDWHGHGANHQGNNNAGDTAADRHNFGDAPAGKSGHNPTAGSAQDDFSAETGLPTVAVTDAAPEADDDGAEEALGFLL